MMNTFITGDKVYKKLLKDMRDNILLKNILQI